MVDCLKCSCRCCVHPREERLNLEDEEGRGEQRKKEERERGKMVRNKNKEQRTKNKEQRKEQAAAVQIIAHYLYLSLPLHNLGSTIPNQALTLTKAAEKLTVLHQTIGRLQNDARQLLIRQGNIVLSQHISHFCSRCKTRINTVNR